MSEVLFEITTDNLDTGLRGYPVGYCTTSTVNPTKGLFYVGRPLSELENKEPIEVIYLLWHGREGSPAEVTQFNQELISRSNCSPQLIQAIQTLPREAHPTKLFSIALLLASAFQDKNSYREDALNLIAQVPTIVATLINHHAGWGPTPPSKPELGYMENFATQLNIPNKQADLTRILKIFNVLHYDHGGGNLSCFVGKSVASSLEDIFGSLSAAMCALAGPRHGKANQESLEFVKGLVKSLGENFTEEELEQDLNRKLANNELIYGFGHAVLRVEDPRATCFFKIAEASYPNDILVRAALLLRKVGTKVLKNDIKIADPYPNVDAISGVLLSAAGFPYPEYYTVLFGLARVVGIARQIVYEREEARNGKGTPIVRPHYIFKKSEPHGP